MLDVRAPVLVLSALALELETREPDLLPEAHAEALEVRVLEADGSSE